MSVSASNRSGCLASSGPRAIATAGRSRSNVCSGWFLTP